MVLSSLSRISIGTRGHTLIFTEYAKMAYYAMAYYANPPSNTPFFS